MCVDIYLFLWECSSFLFFVFLFLGGGAEFFFDQRNEIGVLEIGCRIGDLEHDDLMMLWWVQQHFSFRVCREKVSFRGEEWVCR